MQDDPRAKFKRAVALMWVPLYPLNILAVVAITTCESCVMVQPSGAVTRVSDDTMIVATVHGLSFVGSLAYSALLIWSLNYVYADPMLNHPLSQLITSASFNSTIAVYHTWVACIYFISCA